MNVGDPILDGDIVIRLTGGDKWTLTVLYPPGTYGHGIVTVGRSIEQAVHALSLRLYMRREALWREREAAIKAYRRKMGLKWWQKTPWPIVVSNP